MWFRSIKNSKSRDRRCSEKNYFASNIKYFLPNEKSKMNSIGRLRIKNDVGINLQNA